MSLLPLSLEDHLDEPDVACPAGAWSEDLDQPPSLLAVPLDDSVVVLLYALPPPAEVDFNELVLVFTQASSPPL